MIKTYKVKLKPNNKQKTRLFQFAGASRFIYNWTLQKEQESYKLGNKFISEYDVKKELVRLKKQEEYKWLNNISNDALRGAIDSAVNAYLRFFNKVSDFPKFKSKRNKRQSFYQPNGKIKFTETHVKLEKISLTQRKNRKKLNWIRLCEHNRIPVSTKYYNPRVIFDGLDWWITVGVDIEENNKIPQNKGIGIDVGVKDLAICSDGVTYSNINKSERVKKLENRIVKLQRRISRKYQMNKKGGQYRKTNNIIKSERKLLKLKRRLTNIRDTYIHQITSEIINREPRFIVVEDLNVSGMLKNHKLAKAIQDNSLSKFHSYLQYKSKWNNIKFIKVDRFFPSSKTCSNCGNKKSDLKLSDRTYVCEHCGTKIDRDYNASLNLYNYGLSLV